MPPPLRRATIPARCAPGLPSGRRDAAHGASGNAPAAPRGSRPSPRPARAGEKSRIGRSADGALGPGACTAALPSAAAAKGSSAAARSGIWLCTATGRSTACSPRRALTRSAKTAMSSSPPRLSPARSVCTISSRAVSRAESRTRSKPKPGSNAALAPASLSLNRRRTSLGSRSGRDVPTAMRLTWPSTRNSASSSTRAPSSRRSRSLFRPAASRPVSSSTSSTPVTGSARWRSTDSGATGRRGETASSIRGPAPGRGAPGGRGRSGARAARAARRRRRRPCAARRSPGRRAPPARAAAPRAAAAPAHPPPRPPRSGAAEARRRPGRARRRGQPGADVEPLVEEPRQEVVQHGPFAAEEMGAAGDVEEQAVAAVDRRPAACSGRTSRRGLRAGAGRPVDPPRRPRSTGCMARASAMPMPASARAPQPARRGRRCAGCWCRGG